MLSYTRDGRLMTRSDCLACRAPAAPPNPTRCHLKSTPAAAPSNPESDVVLALRRATRERHERIDRVMDLRRMQDREHYGRILQAFDAFLAPWEDAVAQALPAQWDGWLRHRSRRAFLQQDLHALALPALDAQVRTPRLHGAAEAWGSLYVIEGSALGGQAITRALAHYGLQPASGAAYFHGWGVATATMWQEFRTRLQAELAQPAWAAACDAACQTFDALTALLESVLHERTATA